MIQSPITTSQLVSPESPWLGLRPFTEEARAFFFGRTAELQDLFERIVHKPLCILFGQSGLGKSSLLQAGLLPRLREQGFLPVLVRFIHEPGAPALELQLLERLEAELRHGGFATQAAVVSTLRDSAAREEPEHLPLRLWLLFHDPAHGFVADGAVAPDTIPRPVFLIDQFEEIFTLGERAARRREVACFRESLAVLAENRPPTSLADLLDEDDHLADRLLYKARPVRVLLSLREDFLHLLERWRRVIPSLMDNRVELRMLNGLQALEAVLLPGRLRPTGEAIVPEEVGAAIVRFVAGAEEETPLDQIDAVPPLLSLVCAELNSQRLAAGASQITQSQFEGRSADILTSFYARSFDPATYGAGNPREDGIPQALREARRLIEDRLISPDGFRESIAFDTVLRDLARASGSSAAPQVLNLLVDRRLLTVEERGAVRRVELAHDVLTHIVRASRDERQEAEQLQRVKEERERAEAETLRITRERNRLRRLAAIAVALAVIAAVGAVAGWLGQLRALRAERVAQEFAVEQEKLKTSAQEAELVARQERDRAEQSFQSAFEGLTRLWDEYASTNLENVRGLSWRQSRQLKGELRDYLLTQLQRMHADQPNHDPTIRYLARLMLDEGYAANLVEDYVGALAALDEAKRWSDGIQERTMADQEILAEILMETARTYNNSGQKQMLESYGPEKIEVLNALRHSYPESWRIEYVTVRLENVLLLAEPEPGEYGALAARLEAIMDASGNNIDVVLWYNQILLNELTRETGTFPPESGAYEKVWSAMDHFRTRILEEPRTTTSDLEESLRRFSQYAQALEKHIALHRETLIPERYKDLLREYDKIIASAELRLPRSTEAYMARGELFKLYQVAYPMGLSPFAGDELQAAFDRHQIAAARLGVATSITDKLGPAYSAYVAAPPGPERQKLLLEIRASLQDFASLNLVGASDVLGNQTIIDAVEKLRASTPTDSLLLFHTELLKMYIQLYASSSRTEKSAYNYSFARAVSNLLDSWAEPEHDKDVLRFWESCYLGLPLARFTLGERDALVRQGRIIAAALLRNERAQEARELTNQLLALCDAILAERPWDWYLRDSYAGLCFVVAQAVRENAPDEEYTQMLLRRGWSVYGQMYAREELIAQYDVLGLKGEPPPSASVEDEQFFKRFAANSVGGAMKRFTIPTDFSGTKYPFHVYVIEGPRSFDELLYQFRWVEEYRGGKVPQEVVDSFTRLHAIAVENNVSYMDLCVYALGNAETEDPGKVAAEKLEVAKKDLFAQFAEYQTLDQESYRRRLSEAYDTALVSAAGATTWSLYLQFAEEYLEQLPEEPKALAALSAGYYLLEQEPKAIYLLSQAPQSSAEFAAALERVLSKLPDAHAEAAELKRIHKEAQTSQVPFPELLRTNRFGWIQEERRTALKNSERGIAIAEFNYKAAPSEAASVFLAQAVTSAADDALMVMEWEKAEAYGRRALETASQDTTRRLAQCNLATALLFQDRTEEAYQLFTEVFEADPQFQDLLLQDFDRLEAGGFYHPEMDRIRAALAPQEPEASEETILAE